MSAVKRPLALAGLLLLAAAASCRKKEPAPQILMISSHGEMPAAGPAAIQSASGGVVVAGVSFSPPREWRQESPSSPMRAAQFVIPGGKNEKEGLFVVYFFGAGQGGSVADNVARWEGQFTDAAGKPSEGEVRAERKNGLSVTIVSAQGTYASGMPMSPSAPEPNSELWGAIVEGPQGNVFFKATGPKATIEGARSQFAALLESLRAASATM